MIDVGGPAMVRAAAKNHAHVGVVVDPADYDAGARGAAGRAARCRADDPPAAGPQGVRPHRGVRRRHRRLAGRARGGRERRAPPAVCRHLDLSLERVQELRYGENPHQRRPATARPARGAGGTTPCSTVARSCPT